MALSKVWQTIKDDEQKARRYFRALCLGYSVTAAANILYCPERWRFALGMSAGIAGVVGGLISVPPQSAPPPPTP